MAVSEKDVLHVASLARLAVDPSRLPALVKELNGILEHMEVLGAVDASAERGAQSAEASAERRAQSAEGPSSSRTDSGPPIPLAAPIESFAPQVRDGFFLVPRLATHEDPGTRSP